MAFGHSSWGAPSSGKYWIGIVFKGHKKMRFWNCKVNESLLTDWCVMGWPLLRGCYNEGSKVMFVHARTWFVWKFISVSQRTKPSHFVIASSPEAPSSINGITNRFIFRIYYYNYIWVTFIMLQLKETVCLDEFGLIRLFIGVAFWSSGLLTGWLFDRLAYLLLGFLTGA